MPENGIESPADADEAPRLRHVRVNLLGCYMLSDRREYPCQVQDVSLGGLELLAPVGGRIGERVVAYIDHLGRLEGTIVRLHSIGFAMTIVAPPRKRDKLAAQLTWLANRHLVDLPEERKHPRMVPRNPETTMTPPSGIPVACRIVEMSVSGAAVASPTKPPLNALIRLGRTEGRVVRISEEGFAVAFTYLQDPDFLEANVIIPADAAPNAQPPPYRPRLLDRTLGVLQSSLDQP